MVTNEIPQVRLDNIKRKISRSSKNLGFIHIILGLSNIIFYIVFLDGFRLYIQPQALIKNFAFWIILLLWYVFLAISRFISYLNLANGFNDLSAELAIYHQFQLNSARNVSTNIKISILLEPIIVILTPLILFLWLFLIQNLAFIVIIILIPMIFLILAFKALSPTFNELKKLNLYNDKFINWLLYSRPFSIIALFVLGIAMIISPFALEVLFMERAIAVSLRPWSITTVIIMVVGYVLLIVGLFKLNEHTNKINTTIVESNLGNKKNIPN